ncbi:MAG: hypothetical protein AMXMBFR84_39770 [Candidatus Hydrogenedentota bacterium]
MDSMRTTLTLDDDVAKALERLRKTRDASFKDVVNDTLRAGLKSLQGGSKQSGTFKTRSVSLGRCKIGSLDCIPDVLAIAEGDDYR